MGIPQISKGPSTVFQCDLLRAILCIQENFTNWQLGHIIIEKLMRRNDWRITFNWEKVNVLELKKVMVFFNKCRKGHKCCLRTLVHR